MNTARTLEHIFLIRVLRLGCGGEASGVGGAEFDMRAMVGWSIVRFVKSCWAVVVSNKVGR
jgi:hypothetical protein